MQSRCSFVKGKKKIYRKNQIFKLRRQYFNKSSSLFSIVLPNVFLLILIFFHLFLDDYVFLWLLLFELFRMRLTCIILFENYFSRSKSLVEENKFERVIDGNHIHQYIVSISYFNSGNKNSEHRCQLSFAKCQRPPPITEHKQFIVNIFFFFSFWKLTWFILFFKVNMIYS